MSVIKKQYDTKCPKCGHRFDYKDFLVEHGRHDYASFFEIKCPVCNNGCEVEVEAIPEFSIKQFDRESR